MFDRIAFVNIGWSDTYTGERVKGRHGFLQQGKQGHECYNFKPIQGRFYGYIPPVGGNDPKPDNPMGWLVIFVAPYRGSGELTAVGWYENATFNRSSEARPELEFESPDEDGNRFIYLISTNTAYLINLDQRQEGGIPSDHFRQSSIVYSRGQGSDTWREELAKCAEQIVAGQGEHDGKAQRLGLGGVPEGYEHRRLKEYVKLHPEEFGAPAGCTSETEKRLQSNDEIDVWFMIPSEQLAVEVKSVRSNEIDLYRGIFQCVKYKAVLEAEATCAGSTPNIHALLVSEKALPPEFARHAELLRVKVRVIEPLA